MYSVISCGGKKYKVTVGSKILVNKLDYAVGDEFDSDQVFLHQSDSGSFVVGDPLIKGASYKAKVEKSFRDKKVLIFKKKRRKNYRRKRGHRQDLMEVSILNLTV